MSKSKLERYVGELLYKTFPQYKIKENHRPEWLLSEDFNRLELDYYIEELKIAFEIQGEQHYRFIPFFHREYADFEKRKRADADKKAICAKRGVRLYEIFTELDATLLIREIEEKLKPNTVEKVDYSVYGESDKEELTRFYDRVLANIRTPRPKKERVKKPQPKSEYPFKKNELGEVLGLSELQVRELLFYNDFLERMARKNRLDTVSFRFEHLPSDVIEKIRDGIKLCKNSQDVRRLFIGIHSYRFSQVENVV